MKIKIFFLSLLMVLGNQSVFAQSGDIETPVSNIIPPSPSVASLEKYINFPIGLYTGVPDISIPIWEINGRKIIVPVSLSYHSSGIRVDDIASWVGMGWSLNAGGVISRTVVGLPDEEPNVGYFETAKDFCAYDVYNWEPSEDFKFKAADGLIDPQPDIYSFNFIGHSGKFVFALDSTGSDTIIYVTPYKNIIIKRMSDVRWEITTEDGSRYVFGKIGDRDGTETTSSITYSSVPGDANIYISSWHLLDIISPNNIDTIKFNYVNMVEDFDTDVSYSSEKLMSGDASCTEPVGIIKTYTNVFVGTKKISSIETHNTKVEFTPDTSYREDLTSGNSLQFITIKHKGIEDYVDEDYIKKFKFNYSYFGTGDSLSKRLRLDSIVEQGKNGISKPPFIFQYYPGNMPPRQSFNQDHWGYYNNASNTMSLPEMEYMGVSYTGANRESDPNYAKIGALQSITYPTGGKTSFEYEGNNIYYEAFDKTQVIHDLMLECQDPITCTEYYKYDTIFLQEDQYVEIEVSKHPDDGQEEAVIGEPKAYVNNMEVSTGVLHLNEGYIPLRLELDFDPDSIEQTPFVFLRVIYHEKIDSLPKNYDVGGLRIKKITQYDGIDHSIDMINEYRYGEFNNLNISSGTLISGIPQYYHIKKIKYMAGLFPSQCDFFVRTSHSTASIESVQGSHIGYLNVTVFHGGLKANGTDGNNGRSEHTFNSFGKMIGDNVSPLPPVTIIDRSEYGNLLEKLDYDENGNKVKKSINEYESNTQFHNYYSPGLRVAYTIYSEILEWKEYATFPYKINTQWRYLSRESNIDYFNNGADSVISIRDYYYENPLHAQLTRTKINNSDNTYSETLITYPRDCDGEISTFVKDLMLSKHMESQVIKKEEKYDSTPVKGMLTKYDVFTENNNSIFPLEIKYFENSTYNTRIAIDKYDEFGNILQYHNADDNPISFLWGYNNSSPIAKITNATYGDVQSYEINLQNLSNLDSDSISEANLRTALNNLRTQVPNAMVTTYTYDPLIGMTSASNERGQTTYYEYENFGRLTVIRNNDQDIIKRFEYNYYIDPNLGLPTDSVAKPVISPEAGTYPDTLAITITCATEEAQIYYTIDGLDPDSTSTLYDSTFILVENAIIADTITVKAIAYADGYWPSAIDSVTYIVLPTLEPPMYDPPSGTYDDSVNVSITSTVPDATIWYTVDGSDPDSTSLVYDTIITVLDSLKIKAFITKEGYFASSIDSVEYNVVPRVEGPVFDPIPGPFETSVLVSISCPTEGAIIYYRINSDSTFLLYESPILITESTTIYATAEKVGFNTSSIAEATYSKMIKVANPIFSPLPGIYRIEQLITISCATDSTTIYYTTNGDDPLLYGIEYNESIPVIQSTNFLAIAIRNGFAPSEIVPGNYTLQVKDPTFSPIETSFTDSVEVSIGCETEGALIYFTTDGVTDPSSSSTQYTGPISITETTTFKAIAIKAGWSDSDIEPITYTKVVPPCTLTVTPDSIPANPCGDTFLATVTTNQPSFTRAENESWINTSVSGNQIIITCEPNTGTESREGNIIVTAGACSKTIKVTQDYFSVVPSNYTISQCGDEFDLSVITNLPFSVTKPAWVQSTTILNNTITVTCLPNSGTSQNNGVITVSLDDWTCNKTVSLIQNEKELVIDTIKITACEQHVTQSYTSNVCDPIILVSKPDWVTNVVIISNQISFDCTENIGVSDRQGNIEVTDNDGFTKQIPVIQFKNLDQLDIVNPTGVIDPAGGIFKSPVLSNLTWSSDLPKVIDGWLTIDHSNDSIVFSAPGNNGVHRSATVTISGSGLCNTLTDNILISQDSTPCIITLNPETLNFTYEGGALNIDVYTNKPGLSWDSTDWARIRLNGDFYEFTCDPNPNLEDRNFTIGFTVDEGVCNATLSIVQSGAPPQLSIDPSYKSVDPNGESFTVAVSTNLPGYNIVNDQNWISYVKSPNGETVNFTCLANDSAILRSYNVVFRDLSGNPMDSLQLSQNPNCNFSIITEVTDISSSGILQANAFDVIIGTTEATYDIIVPSWIHYTGPDANNLILVWCDENLEITSRESIIRVQASGAEGNGCYDEFTISQAGATPVLTLNKSIISVSSDASNDDVTVSNNFSNNFTVDIPLVDQSWISYVQSGSLLTFSFTQNTVTSSRNASVTISGAGLTRALNITQAGFVGTLSINPESIILGSVGEQATIQVTSNTSWTVTKDAEATWLSYGPISGSGNGSVTITCIADPNEGGPILPVNNSVYFNPSGGTTSTLSVEYIQSTPFISVSPSSKTVSPTGESFNVEVSNNLNNVYTVTENVSWLSYTKSGSTVTITCDPNTTTSSRSHDVSFAGDGITESVTVTQTGAAPYLIVDPTSQNVSASAGSFNLSVSTNLSSYSGSSNQGWLHVNTTNPTSISYDANTTTTSRSGTVTISEGGITCFVTVTQSGVAPYLTVSPTNQNVTSSAGSFSLSVSTNLSSYSGSSNQGWLHVNSTNPTSVSYDANTSTTSRAGTATIIGGGITRTVTVTQAGAAPYITLSPSSKTISSSSQSFNLYVINNIDDVYSVSESATWLSYSKSGSTITFTCTSNTSTSSRSHNVTISGSGVTKTFPITQNGVPAFIIVSPTSQNVSSSASSFNLSVSTNVSYSGTSNQGWLHVNSSNPTSISYDANLLTSSRSGIVTLSGGGITRTLTVTQSGAAPYLTVSPTNQSVNAAASSFSLSVSTNILSYSGSSNQGWLHVNTTNPTSISYDANTLTTSRSGIVTISGEGISRTVTVSQAGVPFYLTVSPTSQNVSTSSGSFNLSVSTNIPSYTGSSNASWLHVNSPNPTSISYDANTSTSSRSGTVTLSGEGISRTVTVSQAGVPFYLTVSPTSQNVSSSSGSFNLSVSTNIPSYTGSSNASWLHVASPNPTSISHDANTSTSSRSGTVTLSGEGISRTVSVTQSGVSPILTISPTSKAAAPSGETFNVTVTNNLNDVYTVTETATWISYTKSGNTVIISCTQNNTGSSRSANVTITGGGITRTLSITQAAFVATLSLSTNSAIFGSVGDHITVQVTSNTSWTVTKDFDTDWLSFSPISGSGNGSVTITCTADPNGGEPGLPQSALIYFNPNGGTTQSVMIDFISGMQPQ